MVGTSSGLLLCTTATPHERQEPVHSMGLSSVRRGTRDSFGIPPHHVPLSNVRFCLRDRGGRCRGVPPKRARSARSDCPPPHPYDHPCHLHSHTRVHALRIGQGTGSLAAPVLTSAKPHSEYPPQSTHNTTVLPQGWPSATLSCLTSRGYCCRRLWKKTLSVVA